MQKLSGEVTNEYMQSTNWWSCIFLHWLLLCHFVTILWLLYRTTTEAICLPTVKYSRQPDAKRVDFGNPARLSLRIIWAPPYGWLGTTAACTSGRCIAPFEDFQNEL
ncbi:hypothetical protein FRX31_018220 [Thalictrum thalictroides]|uniref:Uncharacterized protein n=1 Tax=Thalictrum thalictroides TaxID=46969 RepID=A0A7J6W5H6_THATH|nr:hypothetical protein FRX31_018220 [Thalictrum thalictroides]